jgi:pimeloyl-ACP methyl ester carboxylesterase
MSTITVKDGTTIYYKDWGKGPVVTFSHGWPLSSDAWDAGLGEELDADYPKSRAPGTVVSHPMCSVIARLSVRVSSPSADHWNALPVWGTCGSTR